MKKIVVILIVYIVTANAFAQKTEGEMHKPKLMVGIVIDQMRYDYLLKFWNKYQEGGFKRLVKDGYVFSNANYNYVPTYTAPGHACIYTGTTPSYNGIVSNEWYERDGMKTMYCVSDSTVKPVGTTSISGKMSPKNLYTSTVTDELRLETNMKSKVIGIALKDRGAILPAGHAANCAYWHDPYTNNWVTSSYYTEALPQWVNEFNNRKLSDSLLNQPWNTLLPADQYTESTSDDNAYEGLFEGEIKPVFPHDLPALKSKNPELIRGVPFGNTFTREFAIAACRGEQMGKGAATDFLAISFSSTDYVGHMYGINSIELEDTYLRLDRELADLLKFLDEWTGKDYELFLTADHGAANNPLYSRDNHLPGGKFETSKINDTLRTTLFKMFGTDSLIMNSNANNIYLNRRLILKKQLDLQKVQDACVNFVSRFPGVAYAMTSTELMKGSERTGIASFMQRGFNPRRSADVMVQLQAGWMDWFTVTGTTHGSAYSYDTHVPVIFYGKNIKAGASNDPISICDIAPTISSLLEIEFPSGNTGRPLSGYFH